MAVKSDIESIEKTNLMIINADTENFKNIIDKIQNKDLFLSNRTILIKRLYRNKEKDSLIQNLLNILGNTSDEQIIFWEDQKIRSTTKYFKFFKEKNLVKEYEALNKRNFLSWLDEELEKNNLKADKETKRNLAERTNYDPERCSNEIKKHKLNNSESITLEDLDILTTDTMEQDIWKLIDSINSGRKEISLGILEKLKSQNNDPNYILSMLARNIRLITLIKHLREQGKTFKEICSILRVPPFSIYPIMDIIFDYDKEKIRYLYSKLSNLDYQIKTGRIEPMLGLTLICPHL
ncbi:MAG: DNA polymerase III subunit delta [Candidatus Dojkabacteria bacterium]|nr:DNA polymerase III subunit delta [Candidatus Dojkabacteria bacterium]